MTSGDSPNPIAHFSDAAERAATARSVLALALALARGLVDMHRPGEPFAAAAVARAADRGGTEIVEADGDPHMGIGRADAVRRIEGHPAEVGDERFRPGMSRLLL